MLSNAKRSLEKPAEYSNFDVCFVSPGAHPLAKKPEDSGYETACGVP